jgi:UDP-2,4-diacetamido-2,4,6-trideoxy-beta-L-altropyranose hydrolase
MIVRRAQEGDMLALWRLANDEGVRRSSFNQDPISLETHEAWFRSKLGSPDCSFWVLEDRGAVAGQIRYERHDVDCAEVHVALARGFRGRGIGTRALRETPARAREDLGATRIRALVKCSNVASLRSFEKAGYVKSGEATVAGEATIVFERDTLESEGAES